MSRKCARDKMWFSNLETMSEDLSGYKFTADKYVEDDGTITLSLNEIDLVENGNSESEARLALGKSILEYSIDYYNDYELYSHSQNRKQHIPYIFKALIIDNSQKIGEEIVCLGGKS